MALAGDDGRCLPNAICVCARTCASDSHPQNVCELFGVSRLRGRVRDSGLVVFSQPSDRRLSLKSLNSIKQRNGRLEWQQTQ